MALGAGAAAAVLLAVGLGGRTAPATREVAAITEAVVPPAAAGEQAAVREPVEIAAPSNIREAPRSDARVVGSAARHERYEVPGRSGAWTRIGRGSAIGWVGSSRPKPLDQAGAEVFPRRLSSGGDPPHHPQEPGNALDARP